jgi:hypothetical protein
MPQKNNKKSSIFSILIIVIFAVLLLMFYTPKCVMDWLFGVLIVSTHVEYVKNDRAVYYGDFPHDKYDGDMIAHDIQNKKVTLYKKDIRSVSEYIDKHTYKDYQIIDCDRHQDYSMFTCAVANTVLKMMKGLNVKSINIGIIVSVRNHVEEKNRHDYGNYLQFAVYKVLKTDTLTDICKKHHKAVTDIQNDQSKLHMNLIRGLKLLKIDYAFNSWRSLSTINQRDGTVLRRIDTYVAPKIFKDIFKKKKKLLIVLDYFDGKYVIGKVRHMMKRRS